MKLNLRLAGSIAVLASLVLAATASAAPPEPKVFVTTLNAAEEVPTCAPATRRDRGLVALHVVDEATGEMRYLIVTNDIPGDIGAAHIHIAPPGAPGPVVQPLALIPGAQSGVIGFGTFTNKPLLDAMQADPDAYYANVHSDVCAPGVIRGQFGGLGTF